MSNPIPNPASWETAGTGGTTHTITVTTPAVDGETAEERQERHEAKVAAAKLIWPEIEE